MNRGGCWGEGGRGRVVRSGSVKVLSSGGERGA